MHRYILPLSVVAVLAVVVGILFGNFWLMDASHSRPSPSDSAAVGSASTPDPSRIEGKWQVVTSQLYGEPDPAWTGAVIDFADDGSARMWKDSTDGIAQATFPQPILLMIGEMTDSLIPFEIATREDDPIHGGAGPRKGIMQLMSTGELVMLESTSAGDPWPTDFSESSKKLARFALLAKRSTQPD